MGSTTSDIEWQQITTKDNEWYNKWYNQYQGQPVAILANFPFFRIRERPSTKHPKANFLNFAEELEEELLNCEQKQVPKKEY